MTRSVTKLPTYRRKFRHIVKALVCHSVGKDVPGGEALVTHSLGIDISEKALVTHSHCMEKDVSGRSTRSIVSFASDDSV